MRETRLASRYAKSLLTLASEKGQLDVAYQDMQQVVEACLQSHELTLLLRSPVIKTDKKITILNAIFGKVLSKISLRFIEIITRKRREYQLQHIAAEFVQQYKKAMNIKTVVVTTAIKLNAELRERIFGIIKGNRDGKVDLIEEVDKTLIGGFVLRIGDNEYNASVQDKLSRLNQSFSETPYRLLK